MNSLINSVEHSHIAIAHFHEFDLMQFLNHEYKERLWKDDTYIWFLEEKLCNLAHSFIENIVFEPVIRGYFVTENPNQLCFWMNLFVEQGNYKCQVALGLGIPILQCNQSSTAMNAVPINDLNLKLPYIKDLNDFSLPTKQWQYDFDGEIINWSPPDDENGTYDELGNFEYFSQVENFLCQIRQGLAKSDLHIVQLK